MNPEEYRGVQPQIDAEGFIKPSDEINPGVDYPFIVTQEGVFKIDKLGHRNVGCGRDVEAAGEIRFKKVGDKLTIEKINSKSGTYKPTPEEAEKFPEIFNQLGVDVNGATLDIVGEGDRVISTRIMGGKKNGNGGGNSGGGSGSGGNPGDSGSGGNN